MKCPGNHPPFWICLRNPQKWKTHFPKKIPLLQFPLGKCRTIIHSANSDIAYNLNDPMILYHTFPILPHIITSFSIVFPPPIQGCSWLARLLLDPFAALRAIWRLATNGCGAIRRNETVVPRRRGMGGSLPFYVGKRWEKHAELTLQIRNTGWYY